MQQTRKLLFVLLTSIAGMASVQHAACAQEVSTPGGYQFFVTPYLWLASVHATTLTPLARVPEVNSNVSSIDLLSHLEGAPFMGSFEARYGNLGFLADAIHLPVSTKITTRDIFFQGGNAALKADTGTGIVLYRFLQDPVQFADGGLGFRAWGFSSNLTLNPGLLQGIALNRTGSWTDPLIGGATYIDKTEAARRKPQTAALVSMTAETDRVYLDTPGRCAIEDRGWRRRVVVEKVGAASTVVWNPWAEKAAAMVDLGDHAWRGIVCIETGNIADNEVRVAPDDEHQMSTVISVDAGP